MADGDWETPLVKQVTEKRPQLGRMPNFQTQLLPVGLPWKWLLLLAIIGLVVGLW